MASRALVGRRRQTEIEHELQKNFRSRLCLSLNDEWKWKGNAEHANVTMQRRDTGGCDAQATKIRVELGWVALGLVI